MGSTKRPLCCVLSTLEEVAGPFYLDRSALKGPLEQTLSTKAHIRAPVCLCLTFHLDSYMFCWPKIWKKSKISKSRLFSILCPTCQHDRRWLCLWQRRQGIVFLPSLPATFSIHSHLPWRAIYSKQATLEANKWLRRSLSCSESGEIAQRRPWLSGCTCIKATAGSGLSSHHEINQIKLSFSRHQHIQCMHESVCFQCLQIHSLCFHPFLFSFSLWLWHLALKVVTILFRRLSTKERERAETLSDMANTSFLQKSME